MRIFILLMFAMFLVLNSCAKNDEQVCRKACERGVHLASKQIDEKVGKFSQDALAEVKIFWKSRKKHLSKAVQDCVVRCMRSEPEVVSCMNSAPNFDEYLKCLK